MKRLSIKAMRILLLFSLTFFTLSTLSCKKEEVKLEQYLRISQKEATLSVGEQVVLNPVFAFEIQPKRTYKWETDHPERIEISVNEQRVATITAKAAGKANVILSSTDGELRQVCEITVLAIPEPVADDGITKILAIGNSFSEDALEFYLHGLAKSKGRQIVIGNLYIGGAALSLHLQNATQNLAAYNYRKVSLDGTKTYTDNYTLAAAIADEDWDYISFQQASPNSGQYNTYVTPLPALFNYVKAKATLPQVKYVLHQTWAYAQNSTQDGFAFYDRDQIKMYNAIVSSVEQAKSLITTNKVIPVGTAIQNGRTSVVGDNFCRDGYHLDLNIGRYTAACTWFEAIFGETVIGNTYKPTALSAFHTEIAQHAAHLAVLKPNEVTIMTDYQTIPTVPGSNAKPIFIGFGHSTIVSGWNTFSGFNTGAMADLKDTEGTATTLAISVTEKFTATNNSGEKVTTTDFNMPQAISSNAIYGIAKAASGAMTVKSALKLSGLNKDKVYNLCFYGSRADAAATDNRETKYTVKGINEVVTRLNALNNKSNIACADAIKPDANGEVTISITLGENNNNASGFYYINAMRIVVAN